MHKKKYLLFQLNHFISNLIIIKKLINNYINLRLIIIKILKIINLKLNLIKLKLHRTLIAIDIVKVD